MDEKEILQKYKEMFPEYTEEEIINIIKRQKFENKTDYQEIY